MLNKHLLRKEQNKKVFNFILYLLILYEKTNLKNSIIFKKLINK